jgi:uncharacterized repeat protein (TIGR03803 family)
MRRWCAGIGIWTVVYWMFTGVVPADYRVLHHFTGGSTDGAGPLNGTLIQSGSAFYGMTAQGGGNGCGTIFRINPDGTGFQLVHSFVSAADDGQGPYGSLILSGSELFGMATSENTSYGGTLFRIQPEGTGFQVLHRFAGSEGKWPYDTLTPSGSILYGANTYGGNYTQAASGRGTLFQIGTDGTGFRLLHTFTGAADDAGSPHGSLLKLGSSLYGMGGGGSSGLGVIFKIDIDGTNFRLLHHFSGGNTDGSSPGGSLIPSDSVLYGMTHFGGTANNGTIFRMDADGMNFQVLHSFTTDSSNGSQPFGGVLVPSGSTLYGMTTLGGSANSGAIFQINMDGTGFRLLHSFSGGANDGARPFGSLTLSLSGTTLHGMTSQGGSQNKGVIFALDVPQPKRVPDPYPTIQAAIDAARAGEVIQISGGAYHENVTIMAKDVILQSSDPADPNVTARTVIEGNGTDPVVKLQNDTEKCVVAGLTIRGGGTGVWCSGGKPVIQGCRIVENGGSGVEILAGAQPTIDHCIIAANEGMGVKLVAPQARGTAPVLTHDAITQNADVGLSGLVTMRNCIVYFNGALPDSPEWRFLKRHDGLSTRHGFA